jgi:hypothetical protein
LLLRVSCPTRELPPYAKDREQPRWNSSVVDELMAELERDAGQKSDGPCSNIAPTFSTFPYHYY